MQFQHVLTQAVLSSAGLDPRGEQVVWQASGWAARIIQHEMDHLQGCLFIDKMDSKTFTNIHWMEVNDSTKTHTLLGGTSSLLDLVLALL